MNHIVAYDIKDGGCEKMRKLLSQYLHHVQNSLFEGELSHAVSKELVEMIKDLLNDGDKVVIYKYRKGAATKECIASQMEIDNVL